MIPPLRTTRTRVFLPLPWRERGVIPASVVSPKHEWRIPQGLWHENALQGLSGGQFGFCNQAGGHWRMVKTKRK